MKKKQYLYCADTTRPESSTGKKPHRFSIKNTIEWSCLVLVCILIGGAGGFFLYNITAPEEIAKLTPGSVTIPSEKEVAASLKKGTVVQDYQDKAYQLINYSLDQYANAPYSLTMTKGATLSAGVTQNIQSCNLTTPDTVFNQNTSASSLVSTASRFYDDKKGTVVTYKASKSSEWATMTPENIDYDTYIQKYGKLLQGKYYCTTDSSDSSQLMTDHYLTSDQAEYEASTDETKHMVNGVMIYYIEKNTTSSSTIVKDGDGYTITADLLPSQGADNYFIAQMKTTGGVSVSFISSTVTFHLDKDLNLVTSSTNDVYNVKLSGLSVKASQTLNLCFFTSDSMNFNGVDVTIPEPDNEEFNGYQLLPRSF